MKSCSKCQSEKIVPDAIVLDHGDYNANVGFRIAVDENPEAWIFKGSVATGVKAKVCGECGFVELYATAPQDLYQAYLRSKEPR